MDEKENSRNDDGAERTSRGRGRGVGSGTGRGTGQGDGQGLGRGGGRGRNKGGAFGPGGNCVCASCGHKEPHSPGIKCTTVKCPECGKPMVREELLDR